MAIVIVQPGPQPAEHFVKKYTRDSGPEFLHFLVRIGLLLAGFNFFALQQLDALKFLHV